MIFCLGVICLGVGEGLFKGNIQPVHVKMRSICVFVGTQIVKGSFI